MVRQMSDPERWRAIGMLEANVSIREVARIMGRAHATIRKLQVKYRRSGNVQHARKGVRGQRLTRARADRRLIRLVRGNPTMPATLLRLLWEERSRSGFLLSAQTTSTHSRDKSSMQTDEKENASVSCSCHGKRKMGHGTNPLAAEPMATGHFHR